MGREHGSEWLGIACAKIQIVRDVHLNSDIRPNSRQGGHDDSVIKLEITKLNALEKFLRGRMH
jgi:hypothetical protein